MASYHLEAFKPVHHIAIACAIEELNKTQIQIAFWVTDPYQAIVYPSSLGQTERCDFLWEHTCFELFIGVSGQDFYREINLSPSGAWQAYAFEEYRYPDSLPPMMAQDIELITLQKTRYGLNATLDLETWLLNQQLKLTDLFLGFTAVIETKEDMHYFALQHSGKSADFHNKHDWLHQF